MRPLRILVLAHEDLLPPDSMEGFTDEEILEWKCEFDVLTTLQNIGHDAQIIGVLREQEPAGRPEPRPQAPAGRADGSGKDRPTPPPPPPRSTGEPELKRRNP